MIRALADGGGVIGSDIVVTAGVYPPDLSTEWPRLTDALLAHFGDEALVRQILGGNLMRLYGCVWR